MTKTAEQENSSAAGAAPRPSTAEAPAASDVDVNSAFEQLSAAANKIADDRTILIKALREICGPIIIAADKDTATACQDLHELICEIAREALEEVGAQ